MKNIRSKFVKDSLLDYEKLTKSLQENSETIVRDILGEAIRDTYNKILSESDENEFDETEVEDTSSDDASTFSNDTDNTDEVSSEEPSDMTDDSTEETTTEVTPDGAVEKTTNGSDGEGNEWSEFEKYKVSDDKYDFSNAEDDEIVKAYKLMKDEDQLIVTKDGDMVHLQDNETGADYLIDLGSVPEESEEDSMVEDKTAEKDFEDDSDDNFEDDNNMMNEQTIFEVALNEYDSHVGYTDNYQKKDVMTNPGMSEPAKSSSTNDWDAGVPHGTEKPWSGKKDKYNAPFSAEKGKTVEEEEDFGNVEPVEEGASMGGRRGAIGSGRSTGTKQHVPNVSGNKNPYGKHHVSVAADYHEGDVTSTNEAIMKKANAIFEENKQLKKALQEFRTTLNEAAVTNVSLGKIVKLISENSTTVDEKKEIISRFGQEAKTVQQANSLYESISNDLKKKNKMNINEDKQFTANSSKMINETQIYKSKDLMDTLGMMHRICKL